MNAPYQCPDCSKILSDGCNRCTCGWFKISESKPVSQYQCRHIEGGIRCKYEGVSSNQIKNPYWLCYKHSKTY